MPTEDFIQVECSTEDECEYTFDTQVECEYTFDTTQEDTCKQSSFTSTLLNAINVLMGIGLLSLPFALKLTGWIVGLFLLFSLSALTLHTALLLQKCLDFKSTKITSSTENTTTTTSTENTTITTTASTDESTDESDTPLLESDTPLLDTLHESDTHTFGDLGRVSFGPSGEFFVSLLFFFELIAANIAFIILASDSFVALNIMGMNGNPNQHNPNENNPNEDNPNQHNPNENNPNENNPNLVVKCIFVALLLPITLFRRMSILAFASFVGICALVNLLIILMIDGLTTPTSPGSLYIPATTFLWPQNWSNIPLAIGLIMSGFAGHAVFPSLYRSMKQPSLYPKMIKTSYLVVFIIYLLFACVGYFMFGQDTLDEVTLNLPLVESFNPLLTHFTLLSVIISPLTKYPLSISPVNLVVEKCFTKFTKQKQAARLIACLTTSSIVLLISIYVPAFTRVMALLGNLFSFTVSVIFPQLCYLKLYYNRIGRREYLMELFILFIGLFLCFLGTIFTFL